MEMLKLKLDITDLELGHLLFALESKANEYKDMKDEEVADEYMSLYYHIDRRSKFIKAEAV